MGLFGRKKHKDDQHKPAPAINPGPLREVPDKLPDGSIAPPVGMGPLSPKPILPPNAVQAMPSGSGKSRKHDAGKHVPPHKGAPKGATSKGKPSASPAAPPAHPAHPAPMARPTPQAAQAPLPRRAALITPAPAHDLVDIASADEDVTGMGDDPSKSATGKLKLALKNQGVDTGLQVMQLLEQIEKQLGQLQHLRTERNTFMADLDKRNVELQAREKKIQELETESRENHRIVEQLKAQAKLDADTVARERSANESSRQLLDAQRKTLEAHQKTLNEQREKVEAERQALESARAEVERDRQQVASAEQALAQRDRELEDARARLSELEGRGAAHQDHTQHLESALTEARGRADALQHELEGIRQQAQQRLEEAQRTAQESIAKRERAIELLSSKLADAEQAAASMPAAPPSTCDEFNAQRRRRLAAVRRGLAKRAAKLQQAHDSLRERKRELDHKAAMMSAHGPMSGVGENQRTLMAQRQQLVDYSEALKGERAKLVQLKDEVERTARRAAARAAKHRASTMLFAIVASLAIVAGASWMAANRFAEATYMASVTVKADPAPGEGTTTRLESWTRAHEAMINDPQFHEKAADRLRSRGIRDLSTPAAVAQFIENSMTIEASEPGQVRITSRGVGAPRTERVLESFAAAVAAQGNAMRDFRADDLPSVVAAAVKIDPVPVEDPRLKLFGMIFGGASALLLFGGLVLWRRIAADQQAFEEKIKLSEGDFSDLAPPDMPNAPGLS